MMRLIDRFEAARHDEYNETTLDARERHGQPPHDSKG